MSQGEAVQEVRSSGLLHTEKLYKNRALLGYYTVSSVQRYRYSLLNGPEVRSSYLHRDGSLKSRKVPITSLNNIYRLVFLMDMDCFLSGVETEILCVI